MIFIDPKLWAVASRYDPVFSNNSWADIIEACQSGQVPDTWVADGSCYKDMLIGGKNYRIDIIGKNHDTYSAGGTAPLTFQMHDCYDITYTMNSSSTNSGGWRNSAMRTTRLPAILALMPAEVQAAIKEVQKSSGRGGGSSSGTQTTSDDLFLLSEIEIFGGRTYSVSGEGEQYAYYKAGNSRAKKVNGSAYWWWERSPISGYSDAFCMVTHGGSANINAARTTGGVAFGFCF